MALGGKEGDSRFFTTQKKGEMHELRMELHATDVRTASDLLFSFLLPILTFMY
jgi:hypothetical protein